MLKRSVTILLLLYFFVYLAENQAQNQIDFRALSALNIEKKLTSEWSLTTMLAGIMTYDMQELGFAWIDGGVKYKLSRNFGVNANYRLFYRRNLDNFYDRRQVLYADLDYAKSFGRWSLGGTARVQSFFYNHIIEGYRRPSVISRNRINLKYKLDYYWQFFAETEIFVPLNHPVRKRPDQIRGSLGLSRTFNRNFKLELYEQVQQIINRVPHNTNFLTGVILYCRF